MLPGWDFGLFVICVGMALIWSVICVASGTLAYWVISNYIEWKERKQEGRTRAALKVHSP